MEASQLCPPSPPIQRVNSLRAGTPALISLWRMLQKPKCTYKRGGIQEPVLQVSQDGVTMAGWPCPLIWWPQERQELQGHPKKMWNSHRGPPHSCSVWVPSCSDRLLLHPPTQRSYIKSDVPGTGRKEMVPAI